MAIPQFEENLDIIANMGDDPKSDNGLTTQEFKMEFDKAGNLIKNYINNVLLPNLNITVDMDAIEKYIKNNALLLAGGIMRGNIDMDGNRISYLPAPVNDSDAATKEFVETLVYTFPIDEYRTVVLKSSNWVNNQQTVTVTGVSENDDITVSAAPVRSNIEAYTEAGIICISAGSNTLTFECADEPSVDISVNVKFRNREGAV